MPRPILIKNGSVILKDRILHNAAVFIKGRTISSVGRNGGEKESMVIDAAGHYISPGFIDTHIHGEALKILKNEIRHGTTSIVVAESCAPIAALCKKAARLRGIIKENSSGPSVLGLRIEGPYINMIKAGAQDRRYIRQPDKRELRHILKKCSPVLKMMTIAPEQKGALPLVRMLAGNEVIASIGHSYATYDEAKKGMRAGIRHATHVFNAMRGMDSREPGVAGAALSDDRVFVEVILDFIHVHETLFALLVQAKDIDKVILVTDSVKALTQKGVKYSRGAYRFPDGKLAGSSLSMIKAVKNAVACGVKLPEAIRFATLNPATLLGVQAGKGSIASGKDADLVIFDKKFNIKMAIVRGKIMYQRKGFRICAE